MQLNGNGHEFPRYNRINAFVMRTARSSINYNNWRADTVIHFKLERSDGTILFCVICLASCLATRQKFKLIYLMI